MLKEQVWHSHCKNGSVIVFRRVHIVVETAVYLRHVRPSVCPHASARLPLERFT
jgi:hypothetical protein